MVTDCTIELSAGDGHRLAAFQASPAGRPRASLVIAAEIFGVNAHIRSVARGYAADGYLAVAPSLFDRVQPGFESGYTPEEVQAGIGLMQRIDTGDALADIAACIAHAERVSPGLAVGIVGYCWGGTLAWLASARLAGLDCAIAYYGGGIPAHADERPKCPVMLHFGELDQKPTPEQARSVAAAHPDATTHFYPAGHGFNCNQRGSFDPASAALARERSLVFLARNLG
jgi:carboxymethylenebutenolidase